MKKLLILGVIVLAGCATNVPVAVKFPTVSQELLQTCPDLRTVEPTTTKLSDVVTVVSENYGTYQECKIKVDSWIDWYKGQQKLWETLK